MLWSHCCLEVGPQFSDFGLTASLADPRSILYLGAFTLYLPELAACPCGRDLCSGADSASPWFPVMCVWAGWGVMCHYSVVEKLWELVSEVPEALELQVLILFSYLSLPSFPSFSCSQFLEENKVIRRNILCFSFGISSSLCCLVGSHVRNTHKKGSEIEFGVRNSGGAGKTSGR